MFFYWSALKNEKLTNDLVSGNTVNPIKKVQNFLRVWHLVIFYGGPVKKHPIDITYKTRLNMSHSQMLGKFEYGGGPIFKVVLEC